ncbi:hypothetical protein E2C01_078537 [Portunus trituberculatus]|uniref:Uncharacterized protein n=1 Tax=Portunus trituberculatus TaxID=210409 RepID=A0A5B7IT11_PORTR|nr:hypothetical protein [Portunus trituberculatus]
MSQPHLPSVMSTVRGGHKPLVVLSFISWELRHRDLRGVLAQALHSHPHFSEGYILNAIEADASEEMGADKRADSHLPNTHCMHTHTYTLSARVFKVKHACTQRTNYELTMNAVA